jgi:hypothetical protein
MKYIKQLVLLSVLLAVSTVLFFTEPSNTPEKVADVSDSNSTSQEQAHHPVSASSHQTVAPLNRHAHDAHHDVANNFDESRLQELIDRHIGPEMRREINQALRPNNQPPTAYQQGQRWVLDTSDRAASVMVAMIDDNGELIITDFMQPLPLHKTEQASPPLPNNPPSQTEH